MNLAQQVTWLLQTDSIEAKTLCTSGSRESIKQLAVLSLSCVVVVVVLLQTGSIEEKMLQRQAHKKALSS